MVSVTFITAKGEKISASGEPGQRLLEVGQIAGMPLEGTCEGQMACSTCHVIVAPEWFERLPGAVDDEEDMLDLAAGVTRTSRLSCQIELTEALDGLVVHVPAEAYDMQNL
ncbi:MAG: 2Fe-2S iron-sulfur cluster-binding protein [Novosphingobium meiothermophilum]|uniref:2Fe-2S iron-sulfur cluster-binding protein n=1 Tax=Novosphingobium TaxID=165696 RepID=UPI000D6DD6CF|nr:MULTISPECIES: 2Fe-2S iron-sulfur cluster-binding protein [Novosphingobium]